MMSSAEQHHFIPEAFLSKWHTPHVVPHLDNRLLAFTWRHGQLRWKRRSARGLCKVAGLYAWQGVDSTRSNELERTLFQRLDNDAAKVHQLLLSEGPASITSQGWTDWIRFLVSMMIRLPHVLDHYKTIAPEILRETVTNSTLKTEHVNLFVSWIEHAKPAFANNIALGGMARFIASSKVLETLLNAQWTIRTLDGSSLDLALSDVPLIRHGRLDEDFFIAVPISPVKLFIVHSGHPAVKALEGLPDTEVVFRVNRDSAVQARQFLIATGQHHRRLAFRLLKRP